MAPRRPRPAPKRPGPADRPRATSDGRTPPTLGTAPLRGHPSANRCNRSSPRRPSHVGKSTLFNRLVGRRLALVDDTPGVTRDRREGEATLGDLSFRVIDTAGFEEVPRPGLEGRMRAQTEAAIRDADAVLMLVDARTGITPADHAFADIVRRSGKPVILVANKSEGTRGFEAAFEAYTLGIGDPVALSAEHGEGLSDLYAAIRDTLPASEEAVEPAGDKPIQVALSAVPMRESPRCDTLLGEIDC